MANNETEHRLLKDLSMNQKRIKNFCGSVVFVSIVLALGNYCPAATKHQSAENLRKENEQRAKEAHDNQEEIFFTWSHNYEIRVRKFLWLDGKPENGSCVGSNIISYPLYWLSYIVWILLAIVQLLFALLFAYLLFYVIVFCIIIWIFKGS